MGLCFIKPCQASFRKLWALFKICSSSVFSQKNNFLLECLFRSNPHHIKLQNYATCVSARVTRAATPWTNIRIPPEVWDISAVVVRCVFRFLEHAFGVGFIRLSASRPVSSWLERGKFFLEIFRLFCACTVTFSARTSSRYFSAAVVAKTSMPVCIVIVIRKKQLSLRMQVVIGARCSTSEMSQSNWRNVVRSEAWIGESWLTPFFCS